MDVLPLSGLVGVLQCADNVLGCLPQHLSPAPMVCVRRLYIKYYTHHCTPLEHYQRTQGHNPMKTNPNLPLRRCGT